MPPMKKQPTKTAKAKTTKAKRTTKTPLRKPRRNCCDSSSSGSSSSESSSESSDTSFTSSSSYSDSDSESSDEYECVPARKRGGKNKKPVNRSAKTTAKAPRKGNKKNSRHGKYMSSCDGSTSCESSDDCYDCVPKKAGRKARV